MNDWIRCSERMPERPIPPSRYRKCWITWERMNPLYPGDNCLRFEMLGHWTSENRWHEEQLDKAYELGFRIIAWMPMPGPGEGLPTAYLGEP